MQKMQFAASQLCFSYLQNPASKDRANWDDLVNRNVDEGSGVVLARHVKQILKIRDGIGDKFNLDYFAITFSAPPGKTVSEFFVEMRQAFPIFAGATGQNVFRPYGFKVLDPKDPDRIENGKKWAQVDHTGALMTFLLLGVSISKTPFSGPEQNTLVQQYGDVQSICTSPTDFIFATVETDTDKHPVSGLRGFGLKDNSDGTWTFYSKAADRRSNSWLNKAVVRTGMGPDVFYKGRQFWDGFYAKMKEHLESKGLTVPTSVFANCNLAEWNGTAMTACEPLKN
ncbi:hypothetical protein [Variovorax sp. LT2P21]|uniref:hypothetical protein n=1 Tax=Variovorax sp. LT2P21 TaxID=3443731 RepID=UPI003F492B37